jgi:hypothetical protein
MTSRLHSLTNVAFVDILANSLRHTWLPVIASKRLNDFVSVSVAALLWIVIVNFYQFRTCRYVFRNVDFVFVSHEARMVHCLNSFVCLFVDNVIRMLFPFFSNAKRIFLLQLE